QDDVDRPLERAPSLVERAGPDELCRHAPRLFEVVANGSRCARIILDQQNAHALSPRSRVGDFFYVTRPCSRFGRGRNFETGRPRTRKFLRCSVCFDTRKNFEIIAIAIKRSSATAPCGARWDFGSRA